jgi:predicted Zn-dependent peptidase
MNVEISKLPNGLTVVSDPMPELESAFVGVWVNTGGRNETRPVMGVSHMLEHMAFKGTDTRSARAIAEEIEAVGGYLNAYTSREQTAFHGRVLKADVPLAVDLLSDILIHPTFEQNELERERQVVLQELGQARDTPDDIVFDHLQAAIYPGQPMGWQILGEEDTVSNFTREHLRDYMTTNYRAGSMILIASGAVDHASIVAMAQEKFAGLRPGLVETPQQAIFGGGDVRVSEDLEQAHLTYGFPGVSNTDPDFYVAQAYVTALGGGMSSRLFQEVREKRGLCYSVYSFSHSAADSGLVGIYAGTGEKEAEEISAVIAGEMASLAMTASEQEVARAKAQLRSGLLMGLERPSARAEMLAAQLFTFGKLVPLPELLEKLDTIDAAAVRRFGERVMATDNPATAAIGPISKFESHARFAQRFNIVRRVAAE